jgi:YesN/AraC family two-component response regulator
MNRNLLIVDDEIDLTDAMSEVLSQIGFKVGTANDGLEAFNYAQNHPVDLIITDVRMPNMDGLELIQRLSMQFPKLGFIVISGFAVKDEKDILSMPGVKRFEHKPVDPKKIISIVKEYFNMA